ncbi:putative WS beta-transducin repeats protein [Paratrimastix pyriformis]|uniref:WS beta-transducin repeats protein n=1 Tax=Paratrimastix pyriformis TaxID=342808 RepID=A0ABQ8UZB0_9EUKA|nr:putative WS beta-transducin repeats protein [Paratrimastix pyriformis]
MDRNTLLLQILALSIILVVLFLLRMWLLARKKPAVASSSVDSPPTTALSPPTTSTGAARTRARATSRPPPRETVAPEGLLATLKGHAGPITGASFSPDGSLFITTSVDRTMRVTHMETLRSSSVQTVRVNLPLDNASACAFTADGHFAALALENSHQIALYDMSPLASHRAPVRFPSRPPTGSPSSISSARSASSQPPRTGTCLANLETAQVRLFDLAASPDGRYLAAGSWLSDVKIFESRLAKDRVTIEGFPVTMYLKGHPTAVYSVSFSAASQRMATIGKDDTLRVWRIADRELAGKHWTEPEQLRLYSVNPTGCPAPSLPPRVCLSPDGLRVAAAFGSNITLYDTRAETATPFATYPESGPVTHLLWSPDGHMLASWTDGGRAVRFWKADL